MKEEIKDKWVKALRSGEYEQGTGKLNRDNKLCCLGVLCELATKEIDLIVEKMDCGGVTYNGEYILPPKTVIDWAGFRDGNFAGCFFDAEYNKHELWDLNDVKMFNFNQIADAIETNWREL